jgi:hypothetical protein
LVGAVETALSAALVAVRVMRDMMPMISNDLRSRKLSEEKPTQVKSGGMPAAPNSKEQLDFQNQQRLADQ